MARGWKAQVRRYGAPAAFLAAVTIAVLLVRAGFQTKSPPAPTTVTTTASTTPTGTTATRPGPRFYRLRSGETLSDVAIRFSVTVDELIALNPGIEPTALTVGQRIRVR